MRRGGIRIIEFYSAYQKNQSQLVMLESFDFQGLGKTAIESTRIPKPHKRGPLPGLGNPQAVGIRIYIYRDR